MQFLPRFAFVMSACCVLLVVPTANPPATAASMGEDGQLSKHRVLVEGTVLGGDDAWPISGARVSLSSLNMKPGKLEGTTGEGGQFQLYVDFVDKNDRLTLTVIAKGFRPAMQEFVVCGPQKVVTVVSLNPVR